MQGNVGASNRRGPGATICLDDIAVNHQSSLPQWDKVGHRPQRAADEALDLLVSAPHPPQRRIPWGAGNR